MGGDMSISATGKTTGLSHQSNSKIKKQGSNQNWLALAVSGQVSPQIAIAHVLNSPGSVNGALDISGAHVGAASRDNQ